MRTINYDHSIYAFAIRIVALPLELKDKGGRGFGEAETSRGNCPFADAWSKVSQRKGFEMSPDATNKNSSYKNSLYFLIKVLLQLNNFVKPHS